MLLPLHASLLKLPYYWDEAGYYVPAALDFFRHGLVIPASTEPTGHTPLMSVYLAVAWRLFVFSPVVTRAAMILFAAGTVTATGILAWRVSAGRRDAREAAIASAALLAIAPLFFAQSVMVHLDLAVAFFTLIAILTLLESRWILFGIAGILAVLTKETAIVLVPVAWAYLWIERRRDGEVRNSESTALAWLATASPCVPAAVWALYYHHHTGFWTGNAGYLQYNLYSTLSPVRILLSFLRRTYEVFVSGFNWLILVMACVAWWWSKHNPQISPPISPQITPITQIKGATQTEAAAQSEAAHVTGKRGPLHGDEWRRFVLVTGLLTAAYLVMLSVVGGAILPRYMLPVYPPLMIAAMGAIWRLPRALARAACIAAAACLVIAWFVNPPYPFPYEDNLAFADFVRLHQEAAAYLQGNNAATRKRPAGSAPRILTAWPATNELETPDLGYVARPLRIVPVDDFSAAALDSVSPDSFDVLYLYSRKWEPPGNWLDRLPWLSRLQSRYFDYAPQMPERELAARFHLKLATRWECRGQWVAIYER